MFKNYFKIAYRNLLRNKGFSFINILGLAIGIASSLLILLWIQHEVSYDQFHIKKDRIYEAWNRDEFSGKLQCWNTTPKILAKTLEADLPEVEVACRVDWQRSMLVTVGEKSLTAPGNMVDSSFLKIFTFPMLKGNPENALKGVYSMVVTEKFARKFFGDDNPIGKTVRINNKDNFTITGLLKDLPTNSRFNFEYLLPWSYLRTMGEDDENWGNNSTKTYALLKENVSLELVQNKMKEVRRLHGYKESKGEMFLYPLDRWRLYSNFEQGKETGGLIDIVRLFGITAAFILLIACINFMNLSTARSEKRAKEVGIRKVIGAQRSSLIGQFIGESVLISLLAGVVAVVLVVLVLPSFNELIHSELHIDYSNLYFWLFLLGFILFTGILAGSYPAFFLSAFQPVKVLKGTFRKSNAVINPRKILVVLQFSFAIVLIICTIIVREQISHAQNRELGYQKDNLVYHMLTGDLEKNFSLVKNELLEQGIATRVSKTSAPPTEGWSDSWGFEWKGKDPNDRTDFDRYCADEELVETIGLKLVTGRDFNLKEFPTDSTAVLLNESAVKAMGFKDPIGQIVKDNGIDWHVIGVIKDFILQSPFYPTKPMVIEGAKGWFNVIMIRLNDNQSTAANISKTEAIFKKYNPAYPFEYKFVDEQYAKKFNSEKRTGTLASLFAGLAIFISCLGLFGLASYMAENRIKEIGVRKVLGASVGNITGLLSKDFITLVLISFLIASPIAWLGMNSWLDNYPYRIQIPWWVFVLAGLLSILIALATVSYQAIKAAVANPVKSLRTE